MLSATEKLFAWRLGTNYRDPIGKATVVAGSFSGSRYAAGKSVTFKVISGHRDADLTSCPGASAYNALASIRAAVRSFMGTGFVSPAMSAQSLKMADGTLTVRSKVVSAMTWTLTVTDANNQ